MDWLWHLVFALRALSSDPDDRWATRLTELDRARAVAFAEGDQRHLADVYVAGSRAARMDAATIEDYAARGGRVVGADLLTLRCRVVRSTGARVELDVVDRLAEAHVVWRDGTSDPLPRDQATRRTVMLQRTADGWRIAGATVPGARARSSGQG